MKKWLIAMLIAAMVAVHHDFWNWRDARLVFDILPVGLAYHALYAILCSLVMALLVKLAWPRDLDSLTPPKPEGPESNK
jgi:hypothetical protein